MGKYLDLSDVAYGNELAQHELDDLLAIARKYNELLSDLRSIKPVMVQSLARVPVYLADEIDMILGKYNE